MPNPSAEAIGTPFTPRGIVAHTHAGRQLLDALEALQGEFNAAAKAGAAVPPGAIVLPPIGPGARAMYCPSSDGVVLTIASGPNNHHKFYKRLSRPEEWHWWHPAHWDGHATRQDAQGRVWTTYLGTFVIDDFGTLVEVEK